MSQDSAVELTTATITGTDAAELCGMTPDAWRMAQMRQRQGATPALPLPEPIGVDTAAPGRPKLYDVSEVVRYRQQLLNSSEVVKRLDEAGVYVRAEVFASTPRVSTDDDRESDYRAPTYVDQDAAAEPEVVPLSVVIAQEPKITAFRVLLTVNNIPAEVTIPAEMLVQAFRVSGWLHDTAYRALRGMFQAYRDHTAHRIERRKAPAPVYDPIEPIDALRDHIRYDLDHLSELNEYIPGELLHSEDVPSIKELRNLLVEAEEGFTAARREMSERIPASTEDAPTTNPFAREGVSTPRRGEAVNP